MSKSKVQLIQPRTVRGFRDYPPQVMIPRERLIEIARGVYRSYGFSPIDTPALEFLEVLVAKGSEETDKQLFRFKHSKHEVAMRFDLTVPLARFVAQYINELGTPFKRYHIATVWRGERPARGRYREFMQCDFDTIGTLDVGADIESALVIHDLFSALDAEFSLGEFTIRVNNRMVLSGLLERLNLAEQSVPILRALDKLAKIGREAVATEMAETAGTTLEQSAEVLRLADLSGSNDDILGQLEGLVRGSETGEAGVARLAELLSACHAVGIPSGRLELDVSIARGLDYYTGTIFETFLTELPGIGSVCSGGRYDNLAGLYTNQQLPGIGASLGLDRLLAALEELGKIDKVSTPATVFVPLFEAAHRNEYLQIAARLRGAGFGVEVYPEPKRLGQQLKYADRRGFKVAVILGSDEFAASTCQVKNLSDGSSATVPIDNTCQQLAAAIAAIVGGTGVIIALP